MEESGHAVKIRYNNGGNWSAWKTIAFTDSDITGNAATATKLAKEVTLWGNEFDGKQDLTGPMTLDNQNPIRWKSSEGSELDAVALNLTNSFLLGQGVAKAGFNTNIYGYTIRFCYGRAGSVSRTAMTITEEGRVLINYSSAILDRRLSIGSGGVFVNATLPQSPILGSVGSNSLLVGRSDYGMQHWVLGNGQGNIQVGRFDGTAVAYALNLNPLGGNVLIGTTEDNGAKLQVAGNIWTSGELFLNHNMSIRLKGNDDTYYNSLFVSGTDLLIGYDSPVIRFAGSKMLINAMGNVGIGITDPKYKLDVKGKISVGDALFLQNVPYSTSGEGSFLIRYYNGNLQFSTRKTDGTLKSYPFLINYDTNEATFNGDLHVKGNIIADGEVSAGGAGEEGETESTGNASAWAQTFTPTNTTMPFEHNRATTDVIVQVYEKNDGGSWDMILVDVEIISETKVNLHFGRTENREHKIVIMG